MGKRFRRVTEECFYKGMPTAVVISEIVGKKGVRVTRFKASGVLLGLHINGKKFFIFGEHNALPAIVDKVMMTKPATGKYLDKWAEVCGVAKEITRGEKESEDSLRERVLAARNAVKITVKQALGVVKYLKGVGCTEVAIQVEIMVRDVLRNGKDDVLFDKTHLIHAYKLYIVDEMNPYS